MVESFLATKKETPVTVVTKTTAKTARTGRVNTTSFKHFVDYIRRGNYDGYMDNTKKYVYGFLGVIIIFSLYLYLFIYCIKVAGRVNDYFNFLIIFGSLSMLLFQFFVNVGMNIGLMPITGITLPLISYGGSSLIATLFALGMISSVDKKRTHLTPEQEF